MESIAIVGLLSMVFVVWFTWHETKKKDDGLGQSKRASLAEAWINICIGFSINFVANFWIIPMMTGVELSNWLFVNSTVIFSYAIPKSNLPQ